MYRLVRLVFCAATTVVLLAQRVSAEDPDAAYDRAVEAGLEAFSRENWPAARAAFTEAHALRPSARTLRGIGLTAYYQGDCVGAVSNLEAALQDTRNPLTEQQRAEAEHVSQACAERVARLTVRVTPPDAAISLNGTPVRTARRLVLDPGTRSLVARRNGHETHTEELTLQAGQSRELDLVLAPLPIAAPAAKPPAVVPSGAAGSKERHPVGRGRRGRPLWPWVTLTGAVALGAASTAVWLSGRDKFEGIKQQCSNEGCTPAERDAAIESAHLGAHETWTWVLAGAAGAAGVASLTLFVLDHRRTRVASLAVRVAGSRVALSGVF